MTDKNGITLGYAGTWHKTLLNDDGSKSLQDYNSIIVFEPMYPTRINTLNSALLSFATQLLWQRKTFCFPIVNKSIFDRHRFDYLVLNDFIVNWLNNHVGKGNWDVLAVSAFRENESPTVLFNKVSNARKFRKFIAEQLEGMPNIRGATLYSERRK